MLSLKLQIPAAILVLLVLTFNLSHRPKKQPNAIKKTASLFLAAPIFFFWFSLVYIHRNNFSDYFILVSIAISITLFFLFRKRIFVFKNKCFECGKKVGIKKTLYVDCPRCEECINHIKTEKSARPDWITFKTPGDKPNKEEQKAVLCFVIRDDEILLIHKKTGLGKGKINGPGGKIEKGETAEQAAVRELREEVKITVKGPQFAGELYFQFTDGLGLHCEVFTAKEYIGTPEETREAGPFWNKIDNIPFDKMWVDDKLWFPLMLSEQKFKAEFVFDGDDMLDYKIYPENAGTN